MIGYDFILILLISFRGLPIPLKPIPPFDATSLDDGPHTPLKIPGSAPGTIDILYVDMVEHFVNFTLWFPIFAMAHNKTFCFLKEHPLHDSRTVITELPIASMFSLTVTLPLFCVIT